MLDCGGGKLKNYIKNLEYFYNEACSLLKNNLFGNFLSSLSTGLIFFILFTVISGYSISKEVIKAIEGEAEISVYYEEDIQKDGFSGLINNIKKIDGIKEINDIDSVEAYNRMQKILGKEAKVLEYLDENPFSPFLEIKIDLEKMDYILNNLSLVQGVQHIRDNREVLDKIFGISKALNTFGYLIVSAAFIITLVLISHIIRLSIYNNRDQINTLRLLGATESFISTPFIIAGFFITLFGGLFAIFIGINSIKSLYTSMAFPIPFIPFPSMNDVIYNASIIIITTSSILGIVGSLAGISSAKKQG